MAERPLKRYIEEFSKPAWNDKVNWFILGLYETILSWTKTARGTEPLVLPSFLVPRFRRSRALDRLA